VIPGRSDVDACAACSLPRIDCNMCAALRRARANSLARAAAWPRRILRNGDTPPLDGPKDMPGKKFQLLLLPLALLAAVPAVVAPPAPDASAAATAVAGAALPLASIGGVHDFPSNYSLWLELGGRGLDTALIYDHGDHDVQWSVGEAVRGSQLPRSEIFVTTKVPCCPAKGVFVQGFDADAWCADHGYYNGTQTIGDSVEHDLGQLGLPSVDLLLLHWPCGTVEQTVAAYRALEPFVRSGKARSIGVSNMNASFLDAIIHGSTIPPSVNQCGFSVGAHNTSTFGSDAATRERCRDRGVRYQAYSPLGGLSGVDVLHHPQVKAIAAHHGASTATVALRWVVQQSIPFVTSSMDRQYDIEDLAAAGAGPNAAKGKQLVLSQAEMAVLSAI
jgi:2,5-diketo-D-gluconate reductase A